MGTFQMRRGFWKSLDAVFDLASESMGTLPPDEADERRETLEEFRKEVKKAIRDGRPAPRKRAKAKR